MLYLDDIFKKYIIFGFALSSGLVTVQEVSQENVMAAFIFISIPLGKLDLVYYGFKPGREVSLSSQ